MVLTKISEVINGRDTVINGRQNNGNANAKNDNCLPCRIISGGGLTILGLYTMFQAKKIRQTSVTKSKLHVAFVISTGIMLTGLGMVRLINQKMPKLA